MLKKDFLLQDTQKVAKDLLGKTLVRNINGNKLSGIITETEAYVGPQDLASHASRGRTKRTEVMFGEAGIWYVYMIYGVYYCLNIVTEKKDYPAAVLIRSVEPIEGIDLMIENRGKNKNIADGPGKLCQAFSIDKKDNELKANTKKLYIEEGIDISNKDIVAAKRIGVDYAGAWKDKLLRFYLKNSSHISKE